MSNNRMGEFGSYARIPDSWHRLLTYARLSGHEWNLVTLAAQDQRKQVKEGQGFYTNARYFNLEEVTRRTGINRNSAKKALTSLTQRILPNGKPVMEPTISRPTRHLAQVWLVNLPTWKQSQKLLGGTTVPPNESQSHQKESPRQGGRGREV